MITCLLRAVVFAMALVVPLQGMAAAAAGVCMAFGHHDAAPAEHDHDPHSGGDATHDQEGDAHCGPCLACCGGAASIAPSMAFTGKQAVADIVEVPLAAAPPGILPSELDRPPLSL